MDVKQVKQFYHDNGYVVLDNAIPQIAVDSVVSLFEKDVRPYEGELLHGPDYRVERNTLICGKLQNALATIQHIDDPQLGDFVDAFFSLYTSPVLVSTIDELATEPNQVMGQTFFYERNWPKGTRLHEDGYFMHNQYDLITAWIALEDIAEDAGRMYVYPGTEKLELPRNEGEYRFDNPDEINDVPKDHPQYRIIREQKFSGLRKYFEHLDRVVESGKFECITPALKAGDVLVFNGEILHGSHAPKDPNHSRLSAIGHYFPPQFRNFANLAQIKGLDVVLNPRAYY